MGADRVFSGTGEDEITAGSADNICVTGDTTVTGDPNETKTGDPTDIPDNITIEGTPEFRARVQADLQVLAASDEGREMIDTICQQWQRNEDR